MTCNCVCFRHYLLGCQFKLYTDHALLQWLSAQKMEGMLCCCTGSKNTPSNLCTDSDITYNQILPASQSRQQQRGNHGNHPKWSTIILILPTLMYQDVILNVNVDPLRDLVCNVRGCSFQKGEAKMLKL